MFNKPIMKERSIQINYIEYQGLSMLTPSDQKFILRAREAAQGGYAPYSGYRVGAAVLLDQDVVVTGNNQENAAYPSGMCAERTALYYAASQHPDKAVEALAVSVLDRQGQLAMAKPCGACRQVIGESEDRGGHPVRILLDGPDTIILFTGIKGLLPLRFTRDDL
jgi:cytidine deaminase